MGLSNASTRARNYSLTNNRNQGGGSKKAGLPYQIGRESYTSVIMGTTNVLTGKCCTLNSFMTMPFTTANQSKPIGGNVGIARDYYKVPGLGKN